MAKLADYLQYIDISWLDIVQWNVHFEESTSVIHDFFNSHSFKLIDGEAIESELAKANLNSGLFPNRSNQMKT